MFFNLLLVCLTLECVMPCDEAPDQLGPGRGLHQAERRISRISYVDPGAPKLVAAWAAGVIEGLVGQAIGLGADERTAGVKEVRRPGDKVLDAPRTPAGGRLRIAAA